VELPIAIILKQINQPVLILVKSKRQLLSKHTQHVQRSCLLIQTVCPYVHPLLLRILVILFHQVILAIPIIISVVNDDIIYLCGFEHEFNDLVHDGEFFLHDLDQSGQPLVDGFLDFRVDARKLMCEQVQDAGVDFTHGC